VKAEALDAERLAALLSAWAASSVRGLLLLDAPGWLLDQAASGVGAALPGEVQRAWLGAWIDDDELWGTLGGTPFATHGMLLPRPGVDHQLLVVPDLTTVSLALARAMVVAVEADTLHVERLGRSRCESSRLRWLVGCRSSDLARVSPHLLDRFPLRARVRRELSDRTQALRDAFTDRRGAALAVASPARDRLPPVDATAAARSVAFWSDQEGPGVRRELGLVRLAQGLARVRGIDRVTASEVDAAAAHLGLTPEPTEAAPEPITPPTDPAPSIEDQPRRRGAPSSRKTAGYRKVVLPESLTLPALPTIASSPEPDSEPEPESEPEPLRLPHDRRGASERGRGPVVGAQPARGTSDLHLPATIQAAAPLQRYRRQLLGERAPDRLIVYPQDLRERRRLPVADDLVLFCIDHTARAGARWVSGLAPFLHLAYAQRARVGVVSFGDRQEGNAALRARVVFGRSLLVPRITRALEAEPGSATPLAHGLELCRRVLLHALGTGRDAARRATLVVLTDGRGNVPLQASLDEVWPEDVRRQGIDDALAVAGRLRSMRKVDMVLLDPRPAWLPELPGQLAQAMGARVVGLAREAEDA
jgi:magnesium chelatase subunit D